jgi:hypothetical protein
VLLFSTTVQVETPFNDVMLAEPDLGAIKDLHTACCVEGGATSSLCTQVGMCYGRRNVVNARSLMGVFLWERSRVGEALW